MLDEALAYGRLGFAVIPLHSWRIVPGRCSCRSDDCPSPAKHPYIANGLRGASSDLDVIASWWKRWPDANIGLRTGDYFDVLDIDDEDGAAQLAALVAENEPLPDAVCAETGRGRHILFAPTGAGNRAGLRPKLDWRGKGGYIVAPPSLHPSGRHYRWITPPDSGDIPEAPAWLRVLVLPPRVAREAAPVAPRAASTGEGSVYGLKSLTAELEALRATPEGMRNHNLNVAAFNLYQLVAGGELREAAVEAELTTMALAIGLGERETAATLASGRRAGVAVPRTAPPLRLVSGGEPAKGTTQTPAPHHNDVGTDVPIEPARTLALRWVADAVASPPPEPPVLINGLLRKGELCVIGAARAVGKSMFGMNMATLLGRGYGLLGGELEIRRPCRVLYAQGELNEWEAAHRWARMSGEDGPPDGVAESFDRWRLRVKRHTSKQTGGADGVAWSESDEFLDAILDGRVEETIAREGIDVLIVDPWAVYFAGNENSNDEVEAGLDKLRVLSLRYGLAIVIIHHIGKATEQREPEDLWRGASRLADWASTRVTLLPYFTETQIREEQMTRQHAREFVKVFILRRGEPTPDFNMRLNHAQGGWWWSFKA